MAQKKQPAKKEETSKQSVGRPAADKQTGKLEKIDKSKAPSKDQPAKKSRGCLLNLIMFLLILAILAGGAFAAAYYLGIIDVKSIKDEVGRKYQLHKYPILEQYFPEVDTNFATVPLKESPDEQSQPEIPSEPKPKPQEQPASQQNNNLLTVDDVAKEEQKKQEDTAKRISRTARLYGEMKPKEAAAVMGELDDDTILIIFSKMEDSQVSKILSLFEPARAARLTEDMLRDQVRIN